MSSVLPTPATAGSWMDSDVLPAFKSQPLPYVVTLVAAVILAYSAWGLRHYKITPMLNSPKLFDMGNSLAKADFMKRAASLLKTADEQFGDKPVRMITDTGNITVLPPNELALEVRNHPNLSFSKRTEEDFFGTLPGFEPFNSKLSSHVLVKVARNQLTKQLTKVTGALSLEAAYSLNDVIGNSPEWKEINLNHTMMRYVSAISSRIFLGDELCRHKLWLETTSQYTLMSFKAIKALRQYPRILVPIVHWFLPECQESRRLLKECQVIIQEVLDRRRAEKTAAAKEGRPILRPDDAVEWAEQESKGEAYDPAVYQIALSLAAIHTTTDLLTQTLLNIVQQPGLIEELRAEVIEVFRRDGMGKTALFNLKLMDSVLKETQRLKPVQMTTMSRKAIADITLSDGTVIKKGEKTAVRSTKRLDPNVYEKPEQFDGARFLRMRDVPGKANQAHLVSTGIESLGFGHGEHACPGRFFAANELKIALMHLLLKYDLKPTDNFQPKWLELGFDLRVNPKASLLLRRREAEIDLDSL